MANRRENTHETYDGAGGSVHAPAPLHTHAHPHTHGHTHFHSHGHPHVPDHETNTRRLAWALAITATFFLAEVVGGWLANSLALLADAGHMLTDVGALALSLFVAWFSRQPASPQKTYGYLRWEILAALINGAVLLVASVWILWESVQRLRAPQPVASGLMLSIAVGGLLVNAASAWLLRESAEQSLNLRGAYLHVLGDMLGSVAAIVAAMLVRWMGWLIADPIASIVMTALILRGGWRLVHEAVDVLLEAAPAHIDAGAVREGMLRVPGVTEVHDLHVWTLTSGLVALSAHVVAPDGSEHPRVLEELHNGVAAFGIRHATIQLERETRGACCPLDQPADRPAGRSTDAVLA